MVGRNVMVNVPRTCAGCLTKIEEDCVGIAWLDSSGGRVFFHNFQCMLAYERIQRLIKKGNKTHDERSI